MRVRLNIKRTLGCALVLLSWSCVMSSQAAQNDSKQFQERIQKYLALQKKAVSSVPPIGKNVTDAAVLAKHEQQIADAIRAQRPNAMPGDIFTPGVKPIIAAIVKQRVDGKNGAGAKSTILGEGNPKNESAAPVNLTVNATYPTTAPLSTMPPSVLKALPPLPKELEYRFVGRTLILRDTTGNLIVDVVPNVF
jgi:hypothetical protein